MNKDIFIHNTYWF